MPPRPFGGDEPGFTKHAKVLTGGRGRDSGNAGQLACRSPEAGGKVGDHAGSRWVT
ncbi:hypothetical protein GCM10027298_26040 [Epidermidibacterium keratini]